MDYYHCRIDGTLYDERCSIFIKIITDYIFDDDASNSIRVSIDETIENLSKELLKSPELLNLSSGVRWRSPLMIACRYGEKKETLKIVKFLLDQPEILVNKKDIEDWTALIFAARHYVVDSVKLLLKHPQILINEMSDDGWTALMHAAACDQDVTKSEKIIKLLLDCPEILVNEKNIWGWTALIYAIDMIANNFTRIVELLLNHSEILVNEKNCGRTPLMFSLYILNNEKNNNNCQVTTIATLIKIIELLLSHPKIDLVTCTFSENDKKIIEECSLRVENRKLQKQIALLHENLKDKKNSPYPGKHYLNSFVEEGFEINENFIKDYFEQSKK